MFHDIRRSQTTCLIKRFVFSRGVIITVGWGGGAALHYEAQSTAVTCNNMIQSYMTYMLPWPRCHGYWGWVRHHYTPPTAAVLLQAPTRKFHFVMHYKWFGVLYNISNSVCYPLGRDRLFIKLITWLLDKKDDDNILNTTVIFTTTPIIPWVVSI